MGNTPLRHLLGLYAETWTDEIDVARNDLREVHGFYRRYLAWLDAHKTFADRLTKEDRRWLKFIKVQA